MSLVVIQIMVVALLFVNSHSFANADTDPSDASALRVMYSSLNSPAQLTNWNSSDGSDPCGEFWKGITCSGNRVTEIQISGLGLSGSMGYQLTSLTSVTNFDISNNNLGNQIPYQLPPNVQRLNLAANGFTGGLPYSISQMTSLQYLNVSHNQIQGELNDMFGSLSSLNTLDISFNSMTGKLPQSFQSLTSMKKIYLQNNQFTGNIDVLANLPLDNLSLENNQFTGAIPEKLKGILHNTGSSGPAPPPPPGTTPPNHKSGGNGSPSSGGGSSDRNEKSGIDSRGVAGIVISVSAVGAVAVFFIIKKRHRKSSTDIEKLDVQPFSLDSQEGQEMKISQNSSTTSMKAVETPSAMTLRPPPINHHKSFDGDTISEKHIVPQNKTHTAQMNVVQYSFADLQMATDRFTDEKLIGEGFIGSVYRAHFDNGEVLTVKKINSPEPRNPEVFQNMVSDISRLHHPNVTELVGYCSEHEQHLLIYEFYRNGSLHDFLHRIDEEDSTQLTWDSRLKIALGTARALEYLHEVCSPSLVHKNIKSENILLDTDLNPHLSDSGLANLVADVDQGLNHNTESGYGAPEAAISGKCTAKSDVYSFGVVMLELFSGRKPFDSSRPRSEQSLVRWATPQLHDIDALEQIVDPALDGLYSVKSLSRFADVIALCVQPEPEFRPPMSEVVQALVRLVQRANLSKRLHGIDQD
ncbi:protein STRUBBELIG-RECEPTOR FAMILY 6-like isoform X2 [Nicotiana tabacum]|uniref:Protein STRUBBELIG-RECEPTOR FAMILY 6-like isoform X2 n=2 Tax=Nicotiana TaxID=4085 RepID=A0A1S4BWD0_TOBAC|nr:PREDICTED: protein STRUBBELIG-RECEPTOR FAMILY 6-like isoform X2 [Nicotiana sylvestris]XP_016493180.1 PREDICTED: protein STRUBBELIG-RECEPTOR FAMILY 6-like isoform X2 [Nicotiana tabacum]